MGHSIEANAESEAQNQQQNDSTKPIEISRKVEKKFIASKSKNCNSAQCKNAKRNDSSDIEFKSDMIFDIEM